MTAQQKLVVMVLVEWIAILALGMATHWNTESIRAQDRIIRQLAGLPASIAPTNGHCLSMGAEGNFVADDKPCSDRVSAVQTKKKESK